MPFIADFLHPYLVREADAGRLRAGVDLDGAAEYLARCILIADQRARPLGPRGSRPGPRPRPPPSSSAGSSRDDLTPRPERPPRACPCPGPAAVRLVRSARARCARRRRARRPLSPRGRIIFWSIVAVLVVGIAVLLVVSVLALDLLAIASADVTRDTLTR